MPGYREIANQLRAALPGPGELLPSEAQLARVFGVARLTVRRALAALRDEGLIRAEQGAGWFTVGTRPAPPPKVRTSTLHEQVAEGLRARIRSGVYRCGQLLPGEQALARDYQVARVTIRTALSALEREGLIQVQRGKGRVVL